MFAKWHISAAAVSGSLLKEIVLLSPKNLLEFSEFFILISISASDKWCTLYFIDLFIFFLYICSLKRLISLNYFFQLYWWFTFWKTAMTLWYIFFLNLHFWKDFSFEYSVLKCNFKICVVEICNFNNSYNFYCNLQAVWDKKRGLTLKI